MLHPITSQLMPPIKGRTGRQLRTTRRVLVPEYERKFCVGNRQRAS